MRLSIILTAVVLLPSFGCAGKGNSYATVVHADSVMMGSFSSMNQSWCSSGACTLSTKPPSCTPFVTFDDFTIQDVTTASFFNSLTEPVFVDTNAKTVTRQMSGLVFSYNYIEALNLWEITYGANCGRLYKRL